VPISVCGVWSWRGVIGKTNGPNGERRDIKGVIHDMDKIKWKKRRAIIAYDVDLAKNPKVRAVRWRLTTAVVERGASVGYLEWCIEEGKGVDDHLASVGPDRVLADIAAVQFGDWRTRLLWNEKKRIISCCDNVALFLENSPEWAGVLGYNELTSAFVVLKTPPSPGSAEPGSEIEDHFDTEVIRWLERRILFVGPDLVRRVVDVVARRNSFHPVRDYLSTLPAWDGVRRIDSW
jgi:Domain of unknown function (DUF3854)